MPRAEPAKGDPLTPRELHMVALAAQGHTDEAIANRLRWSRGVVSNAFCAIYVKLGARNRTNAVAIAFREHLLPVTGEFPAALLGIPIRSPQDVGPVLMRARIEGGLTRHQVEVITGVSGAMLCLAENGKRTPHLPLTTKLLDIYGYDLMAVRR